MTGGLFELSMHAMRSLADGGGAFAAPTEPELLNETTYFLAERLLIDPSQSREALRNHLLLPRVPSTDHPLQYCMFMRSIAASLKAGKTRQSPFQHRGFFPRGPVHAGVEDDGLHPRVRQDL